MPLYFYLILTLVIEIPLVIFFFRDQWKYALLIGILLNLFTWPLLHVVMFETKLPVSLLEGVVTIIEAIGYALFFKITLWKALLISLLANGISYGIGIVI